jgi:hypothetical protein
MRFKIETTLVALIAALAVAVPAPAQTAPNLSGTWVLQVDKSDFGPFPAPQSRTDVIDHQEPRITITRTAVTQNGEVRFNLAFAVDGKPHKNVVNGNELTSTLRWDGPVLVIVSTTSTPQGDVTLTDRWSLSDDGKTLTQARTLEAGGQSLEQSAVFAKQ